MIGPKYFKFTERLVYWLIGLIIIALPLAFWDFGDSAQRYRIVGGWVRILPFLVIFFLNDLWLLPGYFFKQKQLNYFVAIAVIILVVNYLFTFNPLLHKLTDRLQQLFQLVGDPNTVNSKGEGFQRGWKNSRGHFHFPGMIVFVNGVVLSILLVGFNIALKMTGRFIESENQRTTLEKENIESRLSSLQQQISPHFLMNTLNNIHALVEYDQTKARESILMLSKMMRYMLYDSGLKETSMVHEIEFLNSYIALMQLRLNENVKVNFNYPTIIPNADIPPHLFVSYVENAFKHGVSYITPSYISILIEVNKSSIHFNCRNSKVETNFQKPYQLGIGLKNSRNRLDILYRDNYSLNINDGENEFEVDLVFPIST